ncbi:hypothetical protein [Sphingobium sp. CAP-1]|uniref:hypothetical protein n=1 Tax=Sphingobium sp. CAP-1 TaxID=2676077 RepID=UPI0012BB3DD4|nr:hypothetical protein [Sphingobium sp. CAP-1]QGP78097.1 hypothetical protein GL174_03095 [Sphingobium sp. CAP-1]
MAGKRAGATLVPQKQRVGGAVRAQMRKSRKDGWSKADEALFLEVLGDTCNASEAARVVGRGRTGAYRRRRQDAGFARAWADALEMGYGEIELLLMREVLHGSEVEEIVLDEAGAVKARKVKRTRNLAVALRLLAHHRDTVAKIRAEREGERPDSADAIARVDALIGAVRARQKAGVG